MSKKHKSPEPKPESLPETLYVYMEPDGDEFIPLATTDIKSIDEGRVVGEYYLGSTARKTVDHRLV